MTQAERDLLLSKLREPRVVHGPLPKELPKFPGIVPERRSRCSICGHTEGTDEHAGISHLPFTKAHKFNPEQRPKKELER